MPICRRCNLGIPPSFDTCPKCGNPVSEASEPSAPANEQPRAESTAAPSDDYASFFVSAVAPPGPALPPSQSLPEHPTGALGESSEQRAARGSVLRTVALSIGLGVLALVVVNVAVNGAVDSVVHRFGIELVSTMLLYVVVALLVASQLGKGRIRPHIAEGPAATAIAIGVLVGGGAALVLGLLISVLSGHVTSDPRILSVIFEGNAPLVFIVVFISVVAAPLIEEVLFRGLLVESLRSRGRTSAILGGAVAFSLWHLNPGALRYYVLMGFLFGYVYWRLGLRGSISAHAAFNGVLTVFAFAALSGGSLVTSASGVAVKLPGGWHRVTKASVARFDIAAASPLGSALVVDHVDMPATPGMEFNPNAGLPDPGSLPSAATDVRTLVVSGSNALRFTMRLRSDETTIVLVARGSRRYVVSFVPAHSDKARAQFNEMLSSLELPAP